MGTFVGDAPVPHTQRKSRRDIVAVINIRFRQRVLLNLEDGVVRDADGF